MKIENFVTNWETNEKLSLHQREVYRHLEDSYLRNKFSRKEKTVDWDLPIEKKYYLMYEDTLYEFKGAGLLHGEDYLLFTRGDIIITIRAEEVSCGGMIWKVL